MNLAENVVRSAQHDPEHVAFRLDDVTVTYAQFDDATARIAGLLREKGVQPGDRVGLMVPNVPYFPIIYYGALRLGAVVVPMNVLLKGRETTFYLSDNGARVLFAWYDFLEAAETGARESGAELVTVKPGEFEGLLGGAQPVREVTERADDDTAVILYTSGTTGTPKGAELTHGGLYKNAEVTARTLMYLEPDDVVLGALPLFHVFGQTCSMNTCVLTGATLTLLPRFDAIKALEIIQRDRVTVFQGVPTMYVALLNHPDRDTYDTSSLRLCNSGGAALPVEVLRGFDEAFSCKVLEGYGLSETSPVASFNHPDKERKPGSIGTPIEGVEMSLFDDQDREVSGDAVGEIVIRGHNIMKGYWNRPDATAAAVRDGWFHSGDLARRDADGYFFIVDRVKDLIIRGGYNVYPREVEEVLYEHPAVAEAAVVGVPDPTLGEEVAAAVVLKPGASATADELREHVKSQVAAYKYPRHVDLVEALPKGPTGKILKREIRVQPTTT
ncbi:MAG: long-chain fatty acid--CoA ligase [Actinomycetota bacterium]|nr:long-chain fatty acid--CoA ligase [Actinomycetota bacterium]